jgi:VWFA-related protein
MLKRVCLAVLAALFAAVVASAQQDPPSSQEPPPLTFRLEINYVEVDAFVTDAQGNVVRDLTADDFQILEDGRRQTVTAFSLVDIPIERSERPLFVAETIEADVQSNASGEGRIYLIVLDDQHIEPSRGPRVKAAARRFIEENFGSNDLAAVVYTSGRAEATQDFTNNQRLLLNAIDKFTGRKLPSATIERLTLLTPDPQTGQVGPGADTAELERSLRARNVMSAVRRLSEFMSGIRGRRKALLFISEGVDYDIYEAMGQAGATASAVLGDTREAIAAATRGNVIIYGLDPRGLTTGSEDLIAVSTTFPDQGVGLASLQSELRLSQDSLRVLAAETGGFAALNQNDLNAAFDRIVRENSTYYLLGYYSTNERRDGRRRQLQVRVTRPGLQVRARNSYVAARGRAPARPVTRATNSLHTAIDEAMGSPLPMAGVPMTVFAAPYKGTAPNAAVALAVELNLSSFDFVERDGTFHEELEVLYSATDSNGRVFPGDRHRVALTLKPDTHARVLANGFRVLSQIDLPTGRYQIRVAAGNAGGRAGSVIYDLEVPDLHRAPLVMSGVAITSVAALGVSTVAPKEPLRDFLPGPVTSQREFDSNDTLALFAEFYEGARGGSTRTLEMRAELLAEGGRLVRSVVEQRSSTELGTDGGGYGFTAEMPLTDLAPGLYVLRVQGQLQTGDRPLVSREIQLRVR